MPEQPKAYLEWLTQRDGPQIPLQPNLVCRFGREANSTIVLADELVSRNHAFIDCRDQGEYFINDVGSRNGTFVNGLPIRAPQRLMDGDHIAVGQHTFVFRQPDMAVKAVQPVSDCEPTIARISVEVITVLVMDVRGFTDWSRGVGPEKVTMFMSAFFKEADTVLRRHGVWAQKYIGDAVMAIWSHSASPRADVLRSVLESTVEMFQALERLNARDDLDTPLKMGAGINTGPASIGNLGTDGNADYTALGDSVNKAFRLEAATRIDDCDMLIGDGTYQLLDADLRCRVFLPRTVSLKGYPNPVSAWAGSVQDLAQSLGNTPTDLQITDSSQLPLIKLSSA